MDLVKLQSEVQCSGEGANIGGFPCGAVYVAIRIIF